MTSQDPIWFSPSDPRTGADVGQHDAPSAAPWTVQFCEGAEQEQRRYGPAGAELPGRRDGEIDDDLFLLEEPASQPGRRLRAVLVVAVLMTLGFTAGAWLQKRTDAQTVVAAAALQSRAGGFAGRGAFGGQGSSGFGGGVNPPPAGTGASAGGPGPASGPGGVPVLVGSITAVTRTPSGAVLAVTDLGGRRLTVTVTSTTVITAPGVNGPHAGESVAVYGTRPATGPVRATAVVARAAH